MPPSESAAASVLLALSGGVDSSVAAALLQRAVGDQLTCIFVDHGLLRKDEGDQVEQRHDRSSSMSNVRRVNARRALPRPSWPASPSRRRKRKIIGEEFIRVFEDEAKKIGAVDFLAQGTIYPDVVESGLGGESAVIKSHHNVGGLPDCVDFKEIIEPLRRLFKDEVRQLGMELGLPDELVWRQPFPGPGLAIRVIGEITEEKLSILREADAIFREEMRLAGLDRTTSQYFAALTNMRSVGVMGDERTYDYAIALRAVQTQDFMTATWSRLDLRAARQGLQPHRRRGQAHQPRPATTSPPSRPRRWNLNKLLALRHSRRAYFFAHINSSAAQAAVMSPMILIAIIFSSISVRMPRL